jgi:hypothetical protein
MPILDLLDSSNLIRPCSGIYIKNFPVLSNLKVSYSVLLILDLFEAMTVSDPELRIELR